MDDRLTVDRPFAACANCGDTFEREVSYPVVTRANGNQTVELYSFCDAACRRAWEAND